MTAITPFDINISSEAVTDLKQRIRIRAGQTQKPQTIGVRACRWPMCRNW